MNLARREAEHYRDPIKGKLTFKPLNQTCDYGTQRGLEQLYYDELHPDLNKIRPISAGNPRLEDYLAAAREFLSGVGGR